MSTENESTIVIGIGKDYLTCENKANKTTSYDFIVR